MAKPPKGKVPVFPTKDDIRAFIENAPSRLDKREIARAFHLTAAERPLLRQMLKEMEQEGILDRAGARAYGRAGALPDVMVVEITGLDADGELIASPLAWREKTAPPRIFMAAERRGQPVLGVGDRVLARMRRIRGDIYEARAIRRIEQRPARVLGVFQGSHEGGRLHPTDRKHKTDYIVNAGDTLNAAHGDLVLAELLPGRHLGLRSVRVTEILGDMAAPKSISLVAIHTNDIPYIFSEDALNEAQAASAPVLQGREDLRSIPLVTIDGEDARDFDDAVFAEPDHDPTNPGGFHIVVAIADVSFYVRPGSGLDRDAFERGNSVYFPDRVVPMLPEALSNGWCSLKPNEDRGCLAVHIRINAKGRKISHRFTRGLMRSAARLTYDQAQKARDGHSDDTTSALLGPVITPLYQAWQALASERAERGVLELDLPERKVTIGDDGKVAAIVPRERLDSHRLIEDYMIAANVCAAEELERLGQPCMYRVHDLPAPERLLALRDFLQSLSLKLAKGAVLKPKDFNYILERVKDTPQAHLVSEVVLRSQAQAVYSPENLGHFGLGLAKYAHFTSPIRRYADLLVHRALIAGLKLGDGALGEEDGERFKETARHISATERRAASAEREAVNRYTAAFLADRIGARFAARINGVTRFGAFVTLNETGADGLMPMSSLPEDYYIHDEKSHALIGKRSRRTYQLGDKIEVILAEANPFTGGLVFHPADNRRKPTSATGEKPAASKGKSAKPRRPVKAKAKTKKAALKKERPQRNKG